MTWHNNILLSTLFTTLTALATPPDAHAQLPQPPAAPQTQPADSPLLGEWFSSPATGISFRAPAGATKVSNGLPDQIAQFNVPDHKWILKVTKASFSHATPLTTVEDQAGIKTTGILDMTAEHLKLENVAHVIAQDVIHIGDQGQTAVGLLVVRYAQGNDHVLLQEAIVQANDRLYYVLDMSSPARVSTDESGDDPQEKLASLTFNQIVDSVRLLDRTAIWEDQKDRLVRTRALFMNWNKQFIQTHLHDQQYFRLIKDGLDIGYTLELQRYLDGKEDRLANTPIVQVIIRSHTAPSANLTVDAKSTMVVTDDRRHETWSNLELATDSTKGKPVETHLSDVGVYDVKRIVVTARENDGEMLPNNRQDFVPADSASLSVTRMTAHDSLKPFKRAPSVFYLPQALSHMLPTLLPYKEQKKYLFEVYLPEADNGQPALMMRYVDVQAPVELKINGQDCIAIPIADRIGLEGPVTTHYVSNDDGHYLGSVSKLTDAHGVDSVLQMLPTTLEDLQQRYGRDQIPTPDDAAH